ncbi:MAG: sn-glycerol-3-phosphate ABC transporter ATP-binding protein UgpC [Actinomycetota bacterium]
MAEITIEDATKVYPDGTEAVSGLNLEIGDGEFVVLVGPSGCGKTTGLRMVAGLEEISSGTVRIGGRVVNDLPPKDRDVAMVFQNYALYPHMSVHDNMAFALKLRKMSKDEIARRVHDAAEILGLTEYLHRKPKALSGGQRQRVAMGRAIVREPQAFLMDEPLSNLDAKLRVQMRAEISKLQQHLGVTTIYVTHDQTEAMTMGDRVALLKQGHLQQVDAPQVLYERPTNLFVAGFIGSPAMNLVDAALDRDGDRLTITFGSNGLELDAHVLDRRPALRAYEGRRVVVGMRPEDLEDASMRSDAPSGRRLAASIDLLEALGSEVLAHFTVDAPPVVTDDTKELVRDLGGADELEARAEEGTSSFVARLDPRTTARRGEPLELVVDVERLHFFDLDEGSAIFDG